MYEVAFGMVHNQECCFQVDNAYNSVDTHLRKVLFAPNPDGCRQGLH